MGREYLGRSLFRKRLGLGSGQLASSKKRHLEVPGQTKGLDPLSHPGGSLGTARPRANGIRISGEGPRCQRAGCLLLEGVSKELVASQGLGTAQL